MTLAMTDMLVSVIVPNYNYAHYLREAIDGVLAQTYPEIEIIVVDDGSSDASKEILESYGDQIVTIFQSNQGVSAARNNGVMASRGKFVAFLDADDAWLPAKIEREVRRFAFEEDLGLVHVGMREMDADGNEFRERLNGGEGRISNQLLLLATGGILGGGSGFMVPRAVFDEVGGFDTALSTSADWDLFYRIASRYPIGFVSEVLLKYRVHGSNMHANIIAMERDMTLAFEKAFRVMTPELSQIKRQAYGALHQNLAGSYFVAGEYRQFVRHSVRSLAFDAGNIVHFLKFPQRRNGKSRIRGSKPLSIKTNTLDSIRRIFTIAPFEGAMLSLLCGVRYGGFWSRFIPGPHLYPHGAIRKVERDGINYELDVSCLMQWYVYWDFKEKQRDRLYSLVQPGDVVLDVGTNIGETLLHFGKLVGDGGFVFGFEPDDENYRNVRRNMSINDSGSLKVFKLGISDKKEKVKLYCVDPNNLGMNRILNEKEAEQFQNFTTIETDTLDNVITENNIERVDVVKIDIEGYEMHALRGASRLLRTFRPKLFIEVGYSRLINNGASPNEMIAYLEGFGYKIFNAETDEAVSADYDFSPLGDGSIDVYARIDK